MARSSRDIDKAWDFFCLCSSIIKSVTCLFLTICQEEAVVQVVTWVVVARQMAKIWQTWSALNDEKSHNISFLSKNYYSSSSQSSEAIICTTSDDHKEPFLQEKIPMISLFMIIIISGKLHRNLFGPLCPWCPMIYLMPWIQMDELILVNPIVKAPTFLDQSYTHNYQSQRFIRFPSHHRKNVS